MGHCGRAAWRGSVLFLFLAGGLAAVRAQPPQGRDDRARTVTQRWERVYGETGGAGFKSVFSASVQPGNPASPRWLWVGDDKGYLRLAAFDPDSQAPLGPPPSPQGPTRPPAAPAATYFGLSRLEVFTPNAPDVRAKEAPVNAIYFDEQGNGYLLKGNRLYFTDNAGFNWRQLYEVPNLPDGARATLFSIAATGRGACMVGMFSQPDEVRESLVYCTDRPPAHADARWERIIVKPQTQLMHVFFRGDRHGWIVGTQGTILRTTNGRDWRQVEVKAESLLQGYFVSDDDGWVVGLYGNILRTTDGGENWAPVPPPPGAQLANISLRSVKFSRDGKLGWIVGDQGTILHSDDRGETWRVLPPPPPRDARLESPARDVKLEGLFVDDDLCWAVGSGGSVWRQRLR